MSVPKQGFTDVIVEILEKHFPAQGEMLLSRNTLLQYLNYKTKAANRGSKSRPSFGNIYAIYVLVEDYVKKDFHIQSGYENYVGARFTILLARMRELPFGRKLQNHALNHRLNQEFAKRHPSEDAQPVLRDPDTNRYWINEQLLQVHNGSSSLNIACAILEIVDAYAQARQDSLDAFIRDCKNLSNIRTNPNDAKDFVRSLLRPDIDARIFEIVSYAILKRKYADIQIYWGWTPHELKQEFLSLYKTGRTNANDGGIDFIMKPLGRIFQVTETTDVGKYFLDIDKLQRFPITFVVKSEEEPGVLKEKMREHAQKKYKIVKVIERYMECIEEIINVPLLMDDFNNILLNEQLDSVIKEIIQQSQIEFNLDEN